MDFGLETFHFPERGPEFFVVLCFFILLLFCVFFVFFSFEFFEFFCVLFWCWVRIIGLGVSWGRGAGAEVLPRRPAVLLPPGLQDGRRCVWVWPRVTP